MSEERFVMKTCLVGFFALAVLPGTLLAQAPAKITLAVAQKAEAPAAAAPGPVITLYERHGHVTPQRAGFNHTAGGNIDIAQPSPDVVIITMSGVAVAGPHPCKDSMASQDFDLNQAFEITLDKAEGRKLKLTAEARVIGLLRSHPHTRGVAEESGACATIACGPAEVLTVCAPAHSVSGGESLSLNDHEGPVNVPVLPGKYMLHQTFHVAVTCPRGLCGKVASAEFAPDPALDPLWISYWEPFHGANKKDFGFQVILRVAVE
jgi:hypothetical protein